jgi:glycine/D-amino acid oxidase-like deaminating enzyme
MGYDLIVIGGGLVGGAIAWGAATKGASVALLDQGDIAYRAARGNFGLVWVQSKGAGMPAYAHWTRTSSELWPDLAGAMAGATGVDVALRQPGGLAFCLSDEEMASRTALLHRMHNESGDIGTRMLGRDEVRSMVPGLGDRVVGASFCPIDGHANPLYLLRALHAALLQHDVGLSMPVTPLRGQILVTERLRPFLDYATHVIRQTAEGSVMLGDSQEDVGFDTATSATVMQDIAARNVAVFPALKDASIVRVWAALRVMSPDGFPIYEQSAQYPGAFATTCHSGVTLAGAHALALAPAILAGELPERFAPFSSRRFDVPSA